MPRGRQRTDNGKLQYALVTFNYVLHLLGAKSLTALSEDLKDPIYEGVDENGISRLYYAMRDHLHNGEVTTDDLLEYDHHIVKLTNEINEKRRDKIVWKYFQYLSLLFTEIYLDRYFHNKQGLVKELNEFLLNDFTFREGTWDGVPEFTEDDLNKLAFWCATGAGKTLMMQVHIKQYLYYAQKAGKLNDINNIILLTPNEELSRQHLEQLQKSNMSAELFSKGGLGGFFQKQTIQVIDINKLADTNGDKTVAVDSFEGNNLVLIDEAHKGSGGDVWMKYRNKLTENGFSFEYSATFGQAIGALGNKDKKEFLQIYGKATLFDYSYRYFYNDGYGKDYRIMNMREWQEQHMLAEYLTAYLLCLYEQKVVFKSDHRIERDFLIDNPLGVFVGGSVSASSAGNVWNGHQVSDVVMILLFLNDFLKQKNDYKQHIINILNGTTSLTDKNGNAIFSKAFKRLKKDNEYNIDAAKAEKIYQGILKEVFNASMEATLHIDVLKGQDGEIGLRVGTSDYFGLIFVGDTKKVADMCRATEAFDVFEKPFTNRSLFAEITEKTSTVNMLIGSKKFTEGWSCWRVSLMGLMNFGKSEGSQIIQMFGRGVRLKGYKMSLKRSTALDSSIKPHDSMIPKDLKVMETLNIFGVRSNYMDQFKAYLEDEGLPQNDSEIVELTIPTIQALPKGLKILRVDKDYNFKKEVPIRSLLDYRKTVRVTLDWYPKIQKLQSEKGGNGTAEKHEDWLRDWQLDLLNWTEVFFEMVNFKNERSWYNMEIHQEEMREILSDRQWYKLWVPERSMQFSSDYGRDVAEWQEIAVSLLKAFIDKAYKMKRGKEESKHQHIEVLTKEDPNFIREYEIAVSKTQENWIKALQSIEKEVREGTLNGLRRIENENFEALYFAQHLFNPVMFLSENFKPGEGNEVQIYPVAVNKGERKFINDLQRYYQQHGAGREIYLLRNVSRKGIGFFENAGFYPDFILWIREGRKQYVNFIDPKGISHLHGMDDEKIQLYKYLKDVIEPTLGDDSIALNSFIISNTDYRQVDFWGKGQLEKFHENHVLFQLNDGYVDDMMEMIKSAG